MIVAAKYRGGCGAGWRTLVRYALYSLFCTLLLPLAASSPARAQVHSAVPSTNPVATISQALQAGQFAQGVELSRQALAHTPNDPRLWTLQALALASLNEPAKALESYRHATRLAPAYLPALQGAAQLEYAIQSPSAQGTLERIVKLQPGDQTARAMLGEIAFRGHDCPTAVSHLEQAKDAISRREDVQLQLSSCLVELRRFSDAIPILQALHATQPDSPVIRYDLALAQWKSGQPAVAQATLEPVLADGHPSADDLTLAAQIFEAEGNTPRALEVLREAILQDRQNKNAYLDFANLAYQHASVQVGLDVVNLGIKQLPNEAELYFARGVLLAQNGNLDPAFADFDHARQLNPQLAFVPTAQAIAESQSHRFAEAELKLREQVKLHPEDSLAWYLFAEALSERKLTAGSPEYREMIHAAQTAARLAPGQTDAHNLLASVYLRYDEPAQAVAECNASLAIKPKDPQALYQLLMATRKAGPREEVPAIVKRLMEARADADSQAEKSRTHMLTEMSSSAATANPQP